MQRLAVWMGSLVNVLLNRVLILALQSCHRILHHATAAGSMQSCVQQHEFLRVYLLAAAGSRQQQRRL